jgi:hypothetical protein
LGQGEKPRVSVIFNLFEFYCYEISEYMMNIYVKQLVCTSCF